MAIMFSTPLSDQYPRPPGACQVHVGARADPGLTRGMVAQVHRRECGSVSSRLEAPAVGRTMRLPYGTLFAQTIGHLLVQLHKKESRSAVGMSSSLPEGRSSLTYPWD